MKAIAEQANGGVIELRIVPVEHHKLHEKQQEALKDHDVQVRISAQIFSDGKHIGDFKGGKVRIAIPFTPAEGKVAEHHKVYYVAENGDMTRIPSTYVDGHMVLETPHFSDFVIVYEEVAEVEDDAVVDNVVVEDVVEEIEEAFSLPLIPIIVIVIAGIAFAGTLIFKKKFEE